MCRAGRTLVALGLALAGCAGSASSISPVATSASSPASGSVEASGTGAPIVGKWQGLHDCEGMAEALAAGGFEERVIVENIVGNGLLPGVGSPAEVTDIAGACEEATPLEHSHEFTANGQFYSYDRNDQEVDFGTYELVDDDTLVIGDVTFDFSIVDDHLTLEPQLPAGCLEFECQWAIMVAMPWSGMDRGER